MGSRPTRVLPGRAACVPLCRLLGVMVTILLLLKFSDKICRARMTSDSKQGGGYADQYPVDQNQIDLHMMEDGTGTMMDFNLQDSGSVRSQRTANSPVGYSPASEAPPSGYGRELAL